MDSLTKKAMEMLKNNQAILADDSLMTKIEMAYVDKEYQNLNICSAMNRKQCGLRDKYIVFVKGKNGEIPSNMTPLEYNNQTMKAYSNLL